MRYIARSKLAVSGRIEKGYKHHSGVHFIGNFIDVSPEKMG